MLAFASSAEAPNVSISLIEVYTKETDVLVVIVLSCCKKGDVPARSSMLKLDMSYCS